MKTLEGEVESSSTQPLAQVLLNQAIDCIDAALVEVGRGRNELMNLGLSAYTVGTCINRLAGAAGELSTVQRMLPGYEKR